MSYFLSIQVLTQKLNFEATEPTPLSTKLQTSTSSHLYQKNSALPNSWTPEISQFALQSTVENFKYYPVHKYLGIRGTYKIYQETKHGTWRLTTTKYHYQVMGFKWIGFQDQECKPGPIRTLKNLTFGFIHENATRTIVH